MSRPGLDIGRVVMVPLAALVLLIDIHALVRTGANARMSASFVLGWLSAVLVCGFYLLVIWAYLRRGPAVATTRSLSASAVAVVATFAPFFFPLLAGSAPGTMRQVAADALLVVGTSLSVWSLRCLGRYVSVIAQARGIADRGPYRVVRHPLYTGELISAIGLTVLAGTAAACALWCALVTMQVYRARQEEQVLLRALPGYRDYRARTAAFVPSLRRSAEIPGSGGGGEGREAVVLASAVGAGGTGGAVGVQGDGPAPLVHQDQMVETTLEARS